MMTSGLHPTSEDVDPVNMVSNLPGNESSDALKSNFKFLSPSLSELSPETRSDSDSGERKRLGWGPEYLG